MRKLVLIFSLILPSIILAQAPTIGLQIQPNGAYDGYTLFTPSVNNNVYLISNCGEKVHEWNFTENPGLTCYLLENGNLLRAGKNSIEIRDWDNNVIWSFLMSTLGVNQHHDIEPLPNGNVLCLLGDRYTTPKMIAMGRDSSTIAAPFKLDKLIELRPVGNDSAEVVWEWKFADHLIQDFDSTKQNYGIVENHPELIDINFDNSQNKDYTHVNAIDYNEELDQILITARHLGEIYIIDHSTTTEEAASHSGGNSGVGGDLLWRWGNTQVYRQGDSLDQKLFLPHDAKWVESGYLDEGKISVFNNGGDGSLTFSSVHLIVPDINNGIYTLTDSTFEPQDFDWSWNGEILGEVVLEGREGAIQILPNGNFLICESSLGRFSELSKTGDCLFSYVNPAGPTTYNQFEIPSNIDIFRADKYLPDYAGFNGHNLVSLGLIEDVNTYSDTCIQGDGPLAITENTSNISLYGATLNGIVNANSNDATVTFEYGLTTNYGTTMTADQSPVSGSTDTDVSKTISGLTPGTTYHYRVVASNTGGTTEGINLTFTTHSIVEFVYHDEEGVVHEGENIYIAGDFNTWNSSENQLTNNGDGTFSTNITLAEGSYEYKYVLNNGSDKWNWLNSSNRTITVAGSATQDDYRNAASVGWANLQYPSSITLTVGETTENIYGRVYIEGVTDETGEGRSIKAQVGYGTDETPANWIEWTNMSYNIDDGNNDEFTATLTPSNGGSYKYATRFDANWGENNPNKAWVYGDLDGNPYSTDQGGTLTVNFISTSWNGSEWSNGEPNENYNVTINGDYSTSGTFECNNLTVSPNINFTASHTITINGDLQLNSDATGTASILGNEYITINGTTTVQNYLLDYGAKALFWHYISIPVSVSGGAITSDVFGTPYNNSGTDYYALYYNETITDYVGITDNTTVLSEQMRGYAVPKNSAETLEFTGDLIDGTQTTTLSRDNTGYNLIGNPYPSGLDLGNIDAGLTGITPTNLTTTVWIREDGAFNEYNWQSGTAVSGTFEGVLPPMQAAWVRVTDGQTTGSLQFENTARVHNNEIVYKATESNILRFNLSDGQTTDNAVIGLYQNATSGIDNYDSEKMFSDDVEPQVFMTIDDTQCAINGLPASGVSYTIPVGIKTAVDGNYTISFSNITEFDGSYHVFLEDNQSGDLIDLRKQNEYEFYADATESNSRLSVIITKSTNDIVEISSKFSISYFNNSITINAAYRTNATVTVYDISGKIALTQNINLVEGSNRIEFSQPDGVYLVNIRNNQLNFTEKIAIR